ncbi:MAG: 5-bromo-4-chloroindolyl phosphate hydrolysis family protein [Azospirillaceae bacterium]
MPFLTRQRHGIGLTACLAIAIAAPIVDVLPWWLAIPLGFLAWIAIARVLRPPKDLAEFGDLKNLLVDPQLLSRELRLAEERLRRIRKTALNLPHGQLSRQARTLSDVARDLIADVRAEPNDFPRVQRAFTSYLAHVDTMVASLKQIEAVRTPEPELLERVARTMDEVTRKLRGYREKMVDDDAMELEVRMEMIEQSLKTGR